MPEPAIALKNVFFAYNGGGDVLEDVCLTVQKRAFLAIVGPNGGGKTTLIKILLGLLKPDSGSVRVLGADPVGSAPAIGYAPQHQSFEPGFPITVLDVVLLGFARGGRHGFGMPRRAADRALAALEQVDMAKYARRRFDALSGGQRQRVLAARALAADPQLLLFDEPTSNIDPHGKLCMFELLSELSKRITVVMVSHDLVSASAGVTDVAVVNKRLIQGREITPDMLQLAYGLHDAACPVGGYLKNLSTVFDNPATDRTAHD